MKGKRTILSALAISMACAVPIQAAPVSASMAVMEVDGQAHTLPSYLIEGNYYFKLRDVAGMMQGTNVCQGRMINDRKRREIIDPIAGSSNAGFLTAGYSSAGILAGGVV